MKFLIRNNDFWKVILPTILKEKSRENWKEKRMEGKV